MKSIILAAGEGKRLRPLTNNIPKCMVKVDGKPLIEHQVSCLKRSGIEKLIFVWDMLMIEFRLVALKIFITTIIVRQIWFQHYFVQKVNYQMRIF